MDEKYLEVMKGAFLQELEKIGFSVTEKGHQHDAEAYELLGRQMAEQAALLQKYKGLEAEGAPASLGGALRFNIGSPLSEERPDAKARHYEYAAKKHREGSNA